jgi:hypothetical protein
MANKRSSSDFPIKSLEKDFNDETPTKKPKMELYRSVPVIKSEPTENPKQSILVKEEKEIVIRKMVVKNKKGEDFLYSFLVFNTFDIKEDINCIGDTEYFFKKENKGIL